MRDHHKRWQQRFEHFKRALLTMDEAIALSQTRPLSKLEQQGLVQAFEYTHELSWKVMKDSLGDQGIIDIIGSRGATREAFKQGIINEGDVWMSMIEDRNLTSHTYNQNTADAITHAIVNNYYPAFTDLKLRFDAFLATEL